MSDTKEDTNKPKLTVSGSAKLQLTRTLESGQVKQNFTHGRSKTVTVEVRKTRTFTPKEGGGLVEVKPVVEATTALRAPRAAGASAADERLTSDERQARLKALKTAEQTARQAPREYPHFTPPEPVEELEEEITPPPAAETAPAAPAQPLTFSMPGEVVRRVDNNRSVVRPLKSTVVEPQKPVTTVTVRTAKSLLDEEDEEERAKVRKDVKTVTKVRTRGDDPRRNSGKITVTQALTTLSDEGGRMRSLASVRRQREKARRLEEMQPQEKFAREVVIPESITVQELANRMAERAVDVVKILMKLGTMVTVNQAIDADTAELVVSELGHKPKRVAEGDVENVLRDDVKDDPETLLPRAPVVTIMGHVDHGKTSLLDALRQTNVVEGEAGGITQHIGAYQVELESGDRITFLDTPGHEAFTAMRARGAKVTDIVVLVVAADDGIMEQTKEAINHAKAAGVPIIVAINKIDKPGADANRVRNELLQYELVPEEMGGDVMTVEVSAKQRLNLEKLKETILLQAEVLELKANPNRAASGVVVEAKMVHGKGPVATLLVQRGTLKHGDILVAGGTYGRIRAISDDKARSIKDAGPAVPVEVQGLEEVPQAGDEFAVVENEKTARDIAEYRSKRSKTAQAVLSAPTLEQLFAANATGGPKVKELPVVVKADVHGSVEAIVGSLGKLSTDEVKVKVLHTGVGGINESDVSLAQTTGATIIAFNVRATPKAKQLADKEKISIRYYSIIYDLVDEIRAAMGGMLSPTRREKFIGYAEIKQVFNITKYGKVAGCMVTEGQVKRGAGVRLLRDNVVIHEGTLKTLKRFKDEVKEVKSGYECGMAFENYEDIREGDMIEAFEIEEVARTI